MKVIASGEVLKARSSQVEVSTDVVEHKELPSMEGLDEFISKPPAAPRKKKSEALTQVQSPVSSRGRLITPRKLFSAQPHQRRESKALVKRSQLTRTVRSLKPKSEPPRFAATKLARKHSRPNTTATKRKGTSQAKSTSKTNGMTVNPAPKTLKRKTSSNRAHDKVCNVK